MSALELAADALHPDRAPAGRLDNPQATITITGDAVSVKYAMLALDDIIRQELPPGRVIVSEITVSR